MFYSFTQYRIKTFVYFYHEDNGIWNARQPSDILIL